MIYPYDLFISYASENKEIAFHVLEKLENRGLTCFIAPRDIATGKEYASEIIRGISNCTAVLLLFSSNSDKSAYVLREVNSAVSRNKPLIPLRIENFLPSEAMEFYLGPTQWLDAFPEVLDAHLDSIVERVGKFSPEPEEKKEKTSYYIDKAALMPESDIHKIGMNYRQLTMKAIEIDYLCASPDRYELNEELEGTVDDWSQVTEDYGNDLGILLVEKDEVVGYAEAYPVSDESYEDIISLKSVVRGDMIELYSLGGEFCLFVSMLGIIPGHITQKNYLLLFSWLFRKIIDWEDDDIFITRVGISVYSEMLEKFLIKFGFRAVGLNQAKGMIYETETSQLKENKIVRKTFPEIFNKSEKG